MSDLYILYPVVDSISVTSDGSGRLTLVDLVGEENAAAVIQHLTLKSSMGSLDKDEGREAARFWKVSPIPTDFRFVGRGEPKYRECLEDPKNLTVRAIRFAPFETPLLGSPQDWSSMFPNAKLEEGIQLRFVLQAHCDIDDASAHVIFNLEPLALRTQFKNLEQAISDAAESGSPDAAANLSSAPANKFFPEGRCSCKKNFDET